MLVFVDESGDSGRKFGKGSSELMTIILVILADEETAFMVEARIDALRAELKKPGNFEFHFKEDSQSIREAFLRAVAPFPFLYTGLVVNKTQLYGTGQSSPNTFYKDICGWVFELAQPLLSEASVKIDQSGGQDLRRELIAHLKQRMNNAGSGLRHVRQVAMEHSKGNNLIQLADMICGAVGRSYRSDRADTQRYRKIIAHRENTVRYWPE